MFGRTNIRPVKNGLYIGNVRLYCCHSPRPQMLLLTLGMFVFIAATLLVHRCYCLHWECSSLLLPLSSSTAAIAYIGNVRLYCCHSPRPQMLLLTLGMFVFIAATLLVHRCYCLHWECSSLLLPLSSSTDAIAYIGNVRLYCCHSPRPQMLLLTLGMFVFIAATLLVHSCYCLHWECSSLLLPLSSSTDAIAYTGNVRRPAGEGSVVGGGGGGRKREGGWGSDEHQD